MKINMLGYNGIALQFIDNEVFINIFPETNILVNVKRETALHLYKLIQKYNYTVGNDKWGPFWKKIEVEERTLIYMFLDKNRRPGNYRFSFNNEEDLPEDFAKIEENVRLSKIKPEVLKEFEELHKIKVKCLVTKEEVNEEWKSKFPIVYDLIVKDNQLEYLLHNYCEEALIKEKVKELMIKEGKDSFEKPSWYKEFNEEAFNYVVNTNAYDLANTADSLARKNNSKN